MVGLESVVGDGIADYGVPEAVGEEGQVGALGEGELSLQLTADGQAVMDGPVVVWRQQEVDARSIRSSVPKDSDEAGVAT